MLPALWILTLLGIALWSLCAWGLHALLTIEPQWLDDLASAIETLPFGPALTDWLPGWRTLVEAVAGATQDGLAAIAASVPWIVWLVWGAGTVTLLVLAGGLSLLVALLRPRPGGA